MSPRRPKLVSLSILVILLLSVSAVFVLSLTPASHSVVSAYSPRAPIIIDNDTDFAAQALAESWPGTGMVGNPYVIAGYQIDGTGHDNCVYIGNTTVRFVVKECLVENSVDCIALNNLTNGILENNTCLKAVYGIYVVSSCNNTILSNNCTDNGDGIVLSSSSNNTIANNNCSNNGWDALVLYTSSNNNTLLNNTCSYSVNYGIALVGDCINNTLSNNTCSYNSGACGVMIEYSCNGNNLSNNTVSNNVGYGIIIDSNSIGTSSNNRMWNNTLYHNNGAGDVYDSSHVQAYDDGIDNWWNSTDGHGNYWSDWTTPDTDLNGIVDDPYLLDGSAGAQDNYPLATPQVPIPEFGTIALVAMVLLMATGLTIGARRRKAQ
jgi:parallel beta-helix repeat protein